MRHGSMCMYQFILICCCFDAGVLKTAPSPEATRYSAHSLQYQHSGSFSSSDTQLDMFINTPHTDVATAPKGHLSLRLLTSDPTVS